MSEFTVAVEQSHIKKKVTTEQTINISASPTDREKSISSQLNETFNEAFRESLKERGYQRVNFDADIQKKHVVIKKMYLVTESGEVQISEDKHKIPIIGHRRSINLKEKVMNFAMSINIPTPFLIFQKEFSDSFKEGFKLKLALSSVLGTFMSILGASIEQIVTGLTFFILIAIADALLGIMPNTVKGRRSKDHSLQAKAWMFIANLVGIAGLLTVHLFINNAIPDPSGIQHIPANIHYVGISFIVLSYVQRIMKYVATANKTKVPKFISSIFKK
jgi:hypothetical protein